MHAELSKHKCPDINKNPVKIEKIDDDYDLIYKGEAKFGED